MPPYSFGHAWFILGKWSGDLTLCFLLHSHLVLLNLKVSQWSFLMFSMMFSCDLDAAVDDREVLHQSSIRAAQQQKITFLSAKPTCFKPTRIKVYLYWNVLRVKQHVLPGWNIRIVIANISILRFSHIVLCVFVVMDTGVLNLFIVSSSLISGSVMRNAGVQIILIDWLWFRCGGMSRYLMRRADVLLTNTHNTEIY